MLLKAALREAMLANLGSVSIIRVKVKHDWDVGRVVVGISVDIVIVILVQVTVLGCGRKSWH